MLRAQKHFTKPQKLLPRKIYEFCPEKVFISGVAPFLHTDTRTYIQMIHPEKGILWSLHSLITDTKLSNQKQDELQKIKFSI